MASQIAPLIQSYIVDFASNNNFLFVKGVQGDGYSTRYVDITLMNNGQPYELVPDNIRVIIRGTKPDGTEIFNICEVLNNNTIRVEITQQMSAVAGKGSYEISIMSTEENRLLTSFPFFIVISKSSFDIGYVTSSNEFQLLVDKINQVDKINKTSDQLLQEQKELKEKLENSVKKSEAATTDSIKATTDCRNATSEMRVLHKVVQDAEAIRISNENVRITNEEHRIAEEVIRQKNAEDFSNAEAIRVHQENLRQTNTATVITNAEKATQDAINQTGILETLEVTVNENESIRQINESQRIINEKSREDLHDSMQTLENTVLKNEIIRQDQETKRQSNTTIAIGNAEEATNAAWDAVKNIQYAILIDDESISNTSTWSSKKIKEQTQEWFWKKSIDNISISPNLWLENKIYIKSSKITPNSLIDIYYNSDSLDMVAECDLRYKQDNGYLCIEATYLPYQSILIDSIVIENYTQLISALLGNSLKAKYLDLISPYVSLEQITYDEICQIITSDITIGRGETNSN